ncbi:UbiA family prenyltransferase [Candidatus Uabimicrobium amorphum]|uniref:Bacteriochlorophyll synthase 34 kDa chain n=1 Tax=Uabimicrobium amorphum TaxID=2596890 RepID=A0A5S9ILB4_UABAM|nr:UbiA family prenyltransferase [Candidatus Uabimicrobium amorphum]BBM82675.1 bacteriochlorophyll synthase 34 kDa chain [Candidatus Uabimicrobium amorphum]
MKAYIVLLRPFTLLAPAIGIMSGSFVAWGVGYHEFHDPQWWILCKVLLGGFTGAILNGASNAINQIYDYEIDCINKPQRPLPSGKVSMRSAWIISVVLYVASLLIAFALSYEFAIMVFIAAFCTIIYSVPPLRTKRYWWSATLTIVIPRGLLMKVAGWGVLLPIWYTEAWYIGLIFGLFLLGATSTKDYADMEGDKRNNCITLPIAFGVKKSALMIAPSFIVPFLLFPLGVYLKVLHGNPLLLIFLGVSMCIWGSYVVYLILKDPHSLTTTENHPSWRHMYMMMVYAQVVLGVAYFI